MNRWLMHGAIFGFIGVVMGAFGAHALKPWFQQIPDLKPIYETGSEYALVHAVVLLVVGVISDRNSTSALRVSGYAFTIGIVVFSGSLWTLAIMNVRWLGAITPFGGVALIIGWLSLGVHAWNASRK